MNGETDDYYIYGLKLNIYIMRKRSNSKSMMLKPSISDIERIDKEEVKANKAISDLIDNINILLERNDPLIETIKSPKLLLRGLKDLQSMIEMIEIKQSIVNQIKFLISNQARKAQLKMDNHYVSEESKFEGHMLHSVIYGNPGTGKTTVAMILAKIWMSLGLVKRNPNNITTEGKISKLESANKLIDEYKQRIIKLEHRHIDDMMILKNIRSMLNKQSDVVSNIRRKSIKLKNKYYAGINKHRIDKKWDKFRADIRQLRFGFDKLTDIANKGNDINESEDEKTNEDPIFVVASRENLIGEYVGQTAPKTKKVLEIARGGVLFIDEAYSLCPMDGSSHDTFGEECLTTINEFMSLYPDEIIIIFSGYKDKMLESIFTVQPGLYRRCAHFFEIKDYSTHGMAKIFKKQLEKNSWKLASDVDIEKIFDNNIDIIRDGGGFTHKLAYATKIAYGHSKFEQSLMKYTPENSSEIVYDTLSISEDGNTTIHDSIITKSMIQSAMDLIRTNSPIEMDVDNVPPISMYT